jgi:hypothetical protein
MTRQRAASLETGDDTMPANLTFTIPNGNARGPQRWNVCIKSGRATWFIDGTMYGHGKAKESVVHHFDSLLPNLFASEHRVALVGFVASA